MVSVSFSWNAAPACKKPFQTCLVENFSYHSLTQLFCCRKMRRNKDFHNGSSIVKNAPKGGFSFVIRTLHRNEKETASF